MERSRTHAIYTQAHRRGRSNYTTTINRRGGGGVRAHACDSCQSVLTAAFAAASTQWQTVAAAAEAAAAAHTVSSTHTSTQGSAFRTITHTWPETNLAEYHKHRHGCTYVTVHVTHTAHTHSSHTIPSLPPARPAFLQQQQQPTKVTTLVSCPSLPGSWLVTPHTTLHYHLPVCLSAVSQP